MTGVLLVVLCVLLIVVYVCLRNAWRAAVEAPAEWRGWMARGIVAVFALAAVAALLNG